MMATITIKNTSDHFNMDRYTVYVNGHSMSVSTSERGAILAKMWLEENLPENVKTGEDAVTWLLDNNNMLKRYLACTR